MKHTSIFPNCIQSMVAFLLIFTVAFSACEKKSDVGTDHSELKLQAKQIALSRIESQKQHATKEGIEKLNKLIAGLEFENMWIEKESDSTNIIVIPAKIGFETLSKLGNSPVYQLVLAVNKWNGVNRENIVAFIPNNTGKNLLAKGSFPAVLNKRKGAADGRYIFMNFSGSYFYSLDYENGYLKQAGTPLKKTTNQLNARTETEAVCIDWWHVTYYYDENGYFLYKDEEYLYQTCHSCGEVTPWGQTMVCDYIDDGTGSGPPNTSTPLPDEQKSWIVSIANSGIWMVSSTERFSGFNDPNRGGKQFSGVTHLGDNGYALTEGISVTWVKEGVTTSHVAWVASSRVTGKLSVLDVGSVGGDPADFFLDIHVNNRKNWRIDEIW